MALVFANAAVHRRFELGDSAPVALDSSALGHAYWMCVECEAMRRTALLHNGANLLACGRVRDTRRTEHRSPAAESFRNCRPWSFSASVFRRVPIWPIRQQNLKHPRSVRETVRSERVLGVLHKTRAASLHRFSNE